MTKEEYKIICLIIDKHTKKVDGGYYQNDYKEITEQGIIAIKEEIKEHKRWKNEKTKN